MFREEYLRAFTNSKDWQSPSKCTSEFIQAAMCYKEVLGLFRFLEAPKT